MKTLVKGISTLLILAFTSTNAFAFYSDVPTTHPHHKAINELYKSGQLKESIKFNPDSPLNTETLIELLESYGKQNLNESDKRLILSSKKNQILVKHQTLNYIFEILGVGTPRFFNKSTFPFQDLNPASHFGHIAQKAFEIGILEEEQGMFKMAKNITKGEAAQYLYKIREFDPSLAPKTPQIITVEIQPSTSQYTATELELLNNPNFQTFLDVWSKLHNDYYYKNEVDFNKLILNATKGLVSENGDIYTVFQKPDEAQKFLQSISNEYEGVGMSIDIINDNITIVSPFIGSPAEKAGLKPNDIITHINNEDIRGLTLQSVVNKIKGKSGTTVNITVNRQGATLTFSVTRGVIDYRDVQHKIISHNGRNIGYIQVSTFAATTHTHFKLAVEELNEKNPSGYIIDLRNNPGGYLDSAVHLIGSFVGKNKKAVTLKYANGTEDLYNTVTDQIMPNKPVKILINKGSASASEILAGALQDYNKAQLVGEQSFGKGSVQQLNSYTNGALFKYTIAKWLTPNNRIIEKTGLKPDYEVTQKEGEDTQLNTALNLIAG